MNDGWNDNQNNLIDCLFDTEAEVTQSDKQMEWGMNVHYYFCNDLRILPGQ